MKLNKKRLKARREKRSTVRSLRKAAGCGVPFEHYQLLHESAEKITDRRLELNRNNAQLAALIAGGMGIAVGWAYSKADTGIASPEEIRRATLVLVFLVSILAAMFSRWWWKQIESYKDLNRAKFEVMGEMARSLMMSPQQREQLCQFDPFYWEWTIMSANNTLQSYKGGTALGSTWSELVIPKAFLVFFVLTALASIISFLLLAG